MDVTIKKFDVKMDIKNKGIELDVCDTNGKHLGDLVITKSRLIWCKGKKGRATGKKIKWQKFIEYMENL